MASMGQREALRDFLIERRRRLRPADFGLPAGRGRAAGLSQGAVAELAGVSLNWYALLETGRDDRQVSPVVLDRVAGALRLDDAERLELYRLALPRSGAIARFRQDAEDGALATVRAIRGFARRAASASSVFELAALVAETMNAETRPDSATMVTFYEDAAVAGFAVGPRAEYVVEATYRVHRGAVGVLPAHHLACNRGGYTREEALTRNTLIRMIAIGDEEKPLREIQFTPELYREALSGARVLSSLTLPVIVGGRPRALVGMLWSAPRDFSATEIEASKTVAALVQLVTSPLN